MMAFATSRLCDGECCHEDFFLRRNSGIDFCKTALKPYDLAVTATLLIAERHWGESIVIESCGSDIQWLDAAWMCQLLLSYGVSFRFVKKMVVRKYLRIWETARL